MNFSHTIKSRLISSRQITTWTRQLAMLLHAHLPLAQALQLLSHSQAHLPLRTLTLSIYQEVMKGMPLSYSLMSYPLYFDRTYCQLIVAAEQSGQLAAILQQIAAQQIAQQQLRAQLTKALIYPSLVLIVGGCVFLLLLIWVVPQIAEVFLQFNQPLPTFTQFILFLAARLQQLGLYLMVGIAFISISIFMLQRYSSTWSIRFARWQWNCPGIRILLQSAGCILFARTLAVLLMAGIPLAQAIPSSLLVLKNRHVQQRLSAAVIFINQGYSFSYAMQQTWIFPALAIQMWQIGEHSGKLCELLLDSASYYQQQLDDLTAQLTQLIEPLLLIILGVLIGATVVAMYLLALQ